MDLSKLRRGNPSVNRRQAKPAPSEALFGTWQPSTVAISLRPPDRNLKVKQVFNRDKFYKGMDLWTVKPFPNMQTIQTVQIYDAGTEASHWSPAVDVEAHYPAENSTETLQEAVNRLGRQLRGWDG